MLRLITSLNVNAVEMLYRCSETVVHCLEQILSGFVLAGDTKLNAACRCKRNINVTDAERCWFRCWLLGLFLSAESPQPQDATLRWMRRGYLALTIFRGLLHKVCYYRIFVVFP